MHSDSQDAALPDMIEQILKAHTVDRRVDCVGFEARGHGADGGEQPATVLNAAMTVTRAGGAIGIPGLYVTEDPGASDESAKTGNLSTRLGLGWAKKTLISRRCPRVVRCWPTARWRRPRPRRDSRPRSRPPRDRPNVLW